MANNGNAAPAAPEPQAFASNNVNDTPKLVSDANGLNGNAAALEPQAFVSKSSDPVKPVGSDGGIASSQPHPGLTDTGCCSCSGEFLNRYTCLTVAVTACLECCVGACVAPCVSLLC